MTPWESALAFHGHECPGLAIGFRAAEVGLRQLESRRAGDEEIVAIVETDFCGIDSKRRRASCLPLLASTRNCRTGRGFSPPCSARSAAKG